MSELKQFKLPDVGEGLTEAEIVKWHVQPGDKIIVNQIIVEIETAKPLVELPGPEAGASGSAGRIRRQARRDHPAGEEDRSGTGWSSGPGKHFGTTRHSGFSRHSGPSRRSDAGSRSGTGASGPGRPPGRSRQAAGSQARQGARR